MFTKKEAIAEINEAQDLYVSQLADLITGKNDSFSNLKEIDFTSPTGTGKTVMVARLINLLPNYFFVVTTLSRGQLRVQIEKKLKELAASKNYLVFGLNEFTKTTKLQRKEIEASIPWEKKVIWIRDEGHIATNRWAEIFQRKSYRIINFSATNKSNNGIQCNFAHTMMLRTVSQMTGSPEDALDKLVEVKKAHKCVKGYNPCALFRIMDDTKLGRIEKACTERDLKFINITDESFDMSDLCLDENPYDVIINKFKITEGIDLKRCHVVYLDSKPGNEATIVQVIGRARRNALFWRKDIDILKPAYSELLAETRRCYVFYNIREAELSLDENGELAYSLCDTISIEALRPGFKIKVENGQLPNGLRILELFGKTGVYEISFDEEYKCNVVNNPSFYAEERINSDSLTIDLRDSDLSLQTIYLKQNALEFFESKARGADSSYDKRKYSFYCYREYAKSIGSDIDFDYWGKYLNVDCKDHHVKQRAFYAFLHDEDIKSLKYGMWLTGYKLSPDAHQKAIEFAEDSPENKYLEKKNILASWGKNKDTIIEPTLLPFIECVEYLECEPLYRIGKALAKTKNIQRVSENSFRVTSHPQSHYIKKQSYNQFSDFADAVLKYRGKSLFGMKIDYWREMLNTVKSFSQLDQYESSVIDLQELNRLMGLNLSKEEVHIYSKGGFITKSCRGSEISKLTIFEHKGGSVKKATLGQKIVYRQSIIKKYEPYSKLYNDRQIAIIGPDSMKYVGGVYIEDRPVTSKINRFTKFNRFIMSRYESALKLCEPQLFSGHNDFDFDNKCNSCLGFCVEYFAKIKLFGDMAYRSFIETARIEAKSETIDDLIRVRAAMIIYRSEMASCFGNKLMGVIPSITVETLIQESYAPFVNKIIELGLKTEQFVLNHLVTNEIPREALNAHDPNLSVNHISALCDFVTKDTIMDLKCTSSIAQRHILQVLAYHYLSTKRSDLSIKRLIVFDAVTGKNIEIILPPELLAK